MVGIGNLTVENDIIVFMLKSATTEIVLNIKKKK